MSVKQLLILTRAPFSERDYRRFGIEVLARDFAVRVLDCTAWIKPAFWEQVGNIRYEFPGYVMVRGESDLKAQLANAAGVALALDFLGAGLLEQRIRDLVHQHGILRALVYSSVLPKLEAREIERIKRPLRWARDQARLGLNRARRAMAPGSISGLIPDIALLSGEACLDDYKAHAPRQIWGHIFDYDLYLMQRTAPRQATAPYAVFLDQNLVYHSDLLFTGTTPSTTAASYFPPLLRFFDRFEELTGHSVVIAAQPRADYGQKNPFGRRIPVAGKTAELVRDASLVFAHYSAAISFPVLWRKPLVFLTSNDLRGTWTRPFIEVFRSFFDAPLLNIDAFTDDDIDLERLTRVPEPVYARYQRRFIKKPGTPERPLWEIFSDYVQSNLT
jgi:hypothetical protein